MKSLALAAITLIAASSSANAQYFYSHSLTSNSQIEDVGAVQYAYNFDFSGSAATVAINGVTFLGTNVTNGTLSQGMTPVFSIDGGGMDGTGGGDSGDSTQIQTLNESGVYGGTTYTLRDLTANTVYAVQFVFDADPVDNRYVALKDGSVTSNTVIGGIPGPQYIIDTFTATSDTEVITRANDGGLQLSGFVLEVPEPGTWALMALGLAGLAIYIARRPLARS